ncbi:MAG: hypothetical protein HY763_11390 [Planctomycetes bacterium]|nr:hypothetical protein [Planctomycetota bacterium]
MRAPLSLSLGVVLSTALGADASMTLSLAGLARPATGATADVVFSYQSLSDTAARIMVDIHNTSPGSVHGWATAWGFNLPTIAGVTFTRIGGDLDDVRRQRATGLSAPNEPGWYVRFDPGNIRTPNGAGRFDVGVMNNNSAAAFITDGVGGPRAPRIRAGETTRFTLSVLGTGLDNLSNAAFESAFLNERSGGPFGGASFGLRFQGLGRCHDGSDFAVGSPVPLPSSALLAVLGLGGFGAVRGAARRGR